MAKVPELVAAIRLAWKDAAPPAAGRISRPTYDDEGVSEYFAGTSWDCHGAKQLRRYDFAPNIFTEEAFAYYLPGYLIAHLEDPDASDTNVERVLFHLARVSALPSEDMGARVVARLSEAQCSALQRFIEHIRQVEGYEVECTAILKTLKSASGHA